MFEMTIRGKTAEFHQVGDVRVFYEYAGDTTPGQEDEVKAQPPPGIQLCNYWSVYPAPGQCGGSTIAWGRHHHLQDALRL